MVHTSFQEVSHSVMDDFAIPVRKNEKNLEVKRYAKSKCVACSLALAAVVSLCMWTIFQSGDDHALRRLSERSVADEYPRLVIHPLPSNDTDSTLIWYRSYDPKSYKVWVDELHRFIEVYRRPGSHNVYNCDFNSSPRKGQVCDVDVRWLYRTVDENFYYYRATPYIILNLSNLNDWKPDFYNDPNQLPNKMPADLKDYIQSQRERSAKLLNMVWVSCEGENAADKENIGPITYYPVRGFPGYFYPYENTAGYLSPLVALQFERPAIGVLINIECKAWAKNLHTGENQVGTSHFELLID